MGGPALWIGCLLIAATLVMGTTVNGASRWLVIGPIQIQPSELVKPFVVLQAANLFAHWKRTGLDQKLLWLSSFGVLVLLILKQPNLSTAALTGLLIWLMAFSAGLPLFQLFGTAIGGAGADGEVGARTAATGEDLSTLDPSVAAARRSQARAAAREGVSQETLRRAAELETESRGGDVLAGTRWTQGRIVSAC